MLAFGLGALAFFAGDWLIDRRGGADRKDIAGGQVGGSGSAIFIGTLLDNMPESIILGMGLASRRCDQHRLSWRPSSSQTFRKVWPARSIWKLRGAHGAASFGCGLCWLSFLPLCAGLGFA